ncbi:MAG: hypothetical protein LBF16_13025 [Pseudomonadales bacterium]|jgi:hypothetical protein|nr:hypothetical protein [Pseudomonadales bacterium]
MSTLTFDTLKFAKTLETAGVPVPEAMAMAIAVRDSHDAADIATKTDLREVQSVLKNDLREMQAAFQFDLREIQAAFQAGLREVELRMTIKLGTMLVATVGVVVTLLKLLP